MEETNLLKAFLSLKNTDWKLSKSNSGRGTSINRIGEPLEKFVLNLFDEKEVSYIGGPNNPPDIMLKNAEAIEVKKLLPNAREIPLNSSSPKSKLFSTDKMLKKDCVSSEEWKEKDMVYVIGGVQNNTLENIWFVYGSCFAANNEVYEEAKIKLQDGIKKINSLDLGETREIGRVNNIDPFGITNLRIRGMWTIQHPQRIFKDFIDDSNAYMVMEFDKFNSIKEKDSFIKKLLKEIKTEEIKITDPNNPKRKKKAILIRMKV